MSIPAGMKFGHESLERITEDDLKLDTHTQQSLKTETTKEKEEQKQSDSDEELEQESLTILPFFDILYENIV